MSMNTDEKLLKKKKKQASEKTWLNLEVKKM